MSLSRWWILTCWKCPRCAFIHRTQIPGRQDPGLVYRAACLPKVWESTPGFGDAPLLDTLWTAVDEVIALCCCPWPLCLVGSTSVLPAAQPVATSSRPVVSIQICGTLYGAMGRATCVVQQVFPNRDCVIGYCRHQAAPSLCV
jgi:hypothetical protein